MSRKKRRTVHFEDELGTGRITHSYEDHWETENAVPVSTQKDYQSSILKNHRRVGKRSSSSDDVLDNNTGISRPKYPENYDLRVDQNGRSAVKSKSQASSTKTFCVTFSVDNFSDVPSVTNGGMFQHSESNGVQSKSSKQRVKSSKAHDKTVDSSGKDERSHSSSKSPKHHKHHKSQESSNRKHSRSRNPESVVTSQENGVSSETRLTAAAPSNVSVPSTSSNSSRQPVSSRSHSIPASTSSNTSSLKSRSDPSLSLTSRVSASSASPSSRLTCIPSLSLTSPSSTSLSSSTASAFVDSSILPSSASSSRPDRRFKPRHSRPGSEFKYDLAQIVNELIFKVLGSQPSNIPAFCADYLDQKLQARFIEQESQEQSSRNSPMLEPGGYAAQASRVRWSQQAWKGSENQSLQHSLSTTSKPECKSKERTSTNKESKSSAKKSRHFTASESKSTRKQPPRSSTQSMCTEDQPLCSSEKSTCTTKQPTCTPREYTCTTSRLGEVVTDSAALAGVMSGLSTQTPELGDSMSGVMRSLQLKPSSKSTSSSPKAPSTKSDTFHFKAPNSPHIMTLPKQLGAQVTQMEKIGDWIITCSLDNSVSIWSSASGEKALEYFCPKPATNFVLLPNKGKQKWTLLVAMNDGKVAALLVKLGKRVSIKPLEEFHMHHPNPIRAMVVSNDGRFLATGCCFSIPLLRHSQVIGTTHRGTLKTWNLEELLEHLEQEEPNRSHEECNHVALRTSRQLISRNTSYNMIPSYDRFTNKSKDSAVYFGIGALAYSPDSSVIAVGLAGPEDSPKSSQQAGAHVKMLVLCDSASLDTLWVQREPLYEVTSLGFCIGDGETKECPRNLFVGTNQTMATLSISTEATKGSKCDKPDVQVDYVWQKELEDCPSVGALTHDGLLVCVGLGTAVHVFESRTGNHVAKYDGGHVAEITRVKVSGHVILSADREGVVCAWKTPKKIVGSVPLL